MDSILFYSFKINCLEKSGKQLIFVKKIQNSFSLFVKNSRYSFNVNFTSDTNHVWRKPCTVLGLSMESCWRRWRHDELSEWMIVDTSIHKDSRKHVDTIYGNFTKSYCLLRGLPIIYLNVGPANIWYRVIELHCWGSSILPPDIFILVLSVAI